MPAGQGWLAAWRRGGEHPCTPVTPPPLPHCSLFLEWDDCGISYGPITYQPRIPLPPALATVRRTQTTANIRVWRSKWATAYNIRCFAPGNVQVMARNIAVTYPPGLAQFALSNLAPGKAHL